MNSIEAILWDNDGVLVDTEHIYFDATRSVLKEAGVELSTEDYRKHFLTASAGAWHLAAERGFSDADVERMRLRRNDLYADALQTADFRIDGVAPVLADLATRFRMAVVTSARRRHFEIIHARTGFLKHFEFTLAREDYGRSKPDPEPYRMAVNRLELPAEACLVIEDSERGLRAAVAAGLRCWVIPTGLTAGGDLSAAERTLERIEDVPTLLTSMQEGGRRLVDS